MYASNNLEIFRPLGTALATDPALNADQALEETQAKAQTTQASDVTTPSQAGRLENPVAGAPEAVAPTLEVAAATLPSNSEDMTIQVEAAEVAAAEVEVEPDTPVESRMDEKQEPGNGEEGDGIDKAAQDEGGNNGEEDTMGPEPQLAQARIFTT